MNSEKLSASRGPQHDPYVVLGLERSADEAAIKRAYFQKVRLHPPERDPQKFQEIRTAYEQLRSADTRARTDLFLLQPPPELPSRRRPKYDLDVHIEDLIVLAMQVAEVPMQHDFRDIR